MDLDLFGKEIEYKDPNGNQINNMDASEIRIGNLVHLQTFGVCQVEGINSLGMNKYRLITLISGVLNLKRHSEKNITGIELTEKWLLRFGLYKSHDNYGDTYHIMDNNGFTAKFTITFYNKPETKSFFNKWYWITVREIKYVHDVQNIYWALTGTELVLKALNSPDKSK